MVEVTPKKTISELKKGALKTSHGKGRAPLPGVKTDAKLAADADPTDPTSPYFGNTHYDPKGFAANRELAERINKAVSELKTSDEDGGRFVLAWRLYPNADHPTWNEKDVHYCGCGCGCYAPGRQDPKPKSKGNAKASKAKSRGNSSGRARKGVR